MLRFFTVINAKIKNARKVVYNDIVFRSKLECDAYKLLISEGFTPEYESYSFILLEGFTPQKPFYINGEPQIDKKGRPKINQSWKYTPDFIVKYNGIKIYIEMKGFPNDLWPYKRKMFLKMIDSENSLFFEVSSISGLRKTIERIKTINNV